MSENRVIGGGRGMPWYVPEEYEQYLRFVDGNTVIMGRTFHAALAVIHKRVQLVQSGTVVQDQVFTQRLPKVVNRDRLQRFGHPRSCTIADRGDLGGVR